MPEFAMDGSIVDNNHKEPNGHFLPHREIFDQGSPRSPLSTHSRETDSIDLDMNGNYIDTSIEQLYNNVYEMQSSEYSPSRRSFLSYGEESRIDSELRYLAGVDFGELDIKKEVSQENRGHNDYKFEKIKSPKPVWSAKGKKFPPLQTDAISNKPPRSRSKSFNEKPSPKKFANSKNEKNSPQNPSKAGYLGPYLLKQAREMISTTGENVQKALELALRAMKTFESSSKGKKSLEFVMCLHVVAALNCRLGKYTEAVPLLERSIEVPDLDVGQNHALAKFAGCMQLGDTYAMLGQLENSILCYTAGLEIQRQVLGERDTRFGDTCRYVSEAHVQAMQFDEAEKLCQMALDIHRENNSSASPEEAADRRLLGLIYDSKGDYEAALEHYVLAGMAMAANGQEAEVASIDGNIGDAYLSMARYDEAICAYQKALTMFKSTKGENHPSVASVYVRLADLYNKIGKFRESKSYCENALRIYTKAVPGSHPEEIASGLVDVSVIYESMNEPDQALKLLQKAIKVYGNAPGQQSTIAGIEAQIGVLYYILGEYTDSYNSLKNAVSKLREIGEKKSAIFGIALNQMGLASVQLYAINEAADLFEEARIILETECGPYHADTLGIYSNLAGTYDAMGRTDDAIEILEFVVGMREEKLGTANPDVDDEKRRLTDLLRESGRVRSRKTRSLETLLGNKVHIFLKNEEIDILER
ncbi:protein KINESIN LIGHT CHAIN-RELATED 2-like isoform X1 [Lycium ferocissimum]|uniref:protein KINESIN LIGHT CHAIN-RELATED 2-like isoform X1 n=2 Tax=Lycium ferocissimum TaxID=112874 RepID=UPI002815A94F|nr:protein KINESIN LIGHT CHAIN-RELATED 2-like isoform X1 [Lycium ferocissimum]XP_059294131.1 protein KINESIN LIGHT CHAIN-RELATED 2-like isoform X1 [Lycium ferocissimum]XP_059294132.1 protein KINESIN LIGHT CHAIN-RELATED 2-like isoform X1 [Lycium ferocissimum]